MHVHRLRNLLCRHDNNRITYLFIFCRPLMAVITARLWFTHTHACKSSLCFAIFRPILAVTGGFLTRHAHLSFWTTPSPVTHKTIGTQGWIRLFKKQCYFRALPSPRLLVSSPPQLAVSRDNSLICHRARPERVCDGETGTGNRMCVGEVGELCDWVKHQLYDGGKRS